MAKYCVFGSSGFIGSYLVKQLQEEGHEVIQVGRKKKDVVNYYDWDGLTYLKLERLMDGVTGVVNLAYASTPKTSFDDPIADIRDNLPSIVNFLEWMSFFSLDKIIMVSTGGAIYGNTNENPISEKAATNPISPYGITKLAVEKYSSMYFTHKKLPIVIIRPGNAYGIGQKPFIGQGFIATAAYSILERKRLKIFGKTGTVRDYIHVTDVANGIVKALEYGQVGETYNLGTGKGVSTKYLIDLLSKISQKDGYEVPNIDYESLRPFDVKRNVLNCKKLQQHTGWLPTTNIKEGIQEYWEHALKTHRQKSLDRILWI
ncbi:NAD-dependent epimerase/dehydratase family protein [Zunongwangia sp.]|uniref:NAD-dependent epimerase/dehydratase family protein n=1 Tax=Zunongwangia sp. TaxID=1965325 RepID=UPI003AA7D300